MTLSGESNIFGGINGIINFKQQEAVFHEPQQRIFLREEDPQLARFLFRKYFIEKLFFGKCVQEGICLRECPSH